MDPLMEQMLRLVERVPFSVIVALWFMFRLEQLLQRMDQHHMEETIVLTEIRDELRGDTHHASRSDSNY